MDHEFNLVKLIRTVRNMKIFIKKELNIHSALLEKKAYHSLRKNGNTLKLYKTIEPDTRNVKPFIRSNGFDIFLFFKRHLFISTSDVEHR